MTFREFVAFILGREEDGGEPEDPSRRKFFKKAGVGVAAIPAGVVTVKEGLSKGQDPKVDYIGPPDQLTPTPEKEAPTATPLADPGREPKPTKRPDFGDSPYFCSEGAPIWGPATPIYDVRGKVVCVSAPLPVWRHGETLESVDDRQARLRREKGNDGRNRSDDKDNSAWY